MPPACEAASDCAHVTLRVSDDADSHSACSHARLRMLISQVNAPAGNKNPEQPAISSWSAPLPFKVCSFHMQQT